MTVRNKFMVSIAVASLFILAGCSTHSVVRPSTPSPSSTVVTTTPRPGEQTPSPVENIGIQAFTLPFHNSTKILKVTPLAKSDSVELASLSLSVVNLDGTSMFVGTSDEVSLTGNSGGLFVPFAMTKDDAHVILRARMGSPGAGGSSVDYGYIQFPVDVASNATLSLTEKLREMSKETWNKTIFVATPSAHFYDTFGKVVYVDEGTNTIGQYKPGPSNNAQLVFRNLVTNTTKTLLAEADRSYEIISVDESKGTAHIKVTQYTFTPTCPRQEGNQSCADKTVNEQTIQLP